MFRLMLFLHVIAATIWTGGHLVLSFVVLPRALKERSLDLIQWFESRYERIAMPALAIQVLTGLWLLQHLEPDVAAWFDYGRESAKLITAKLALLIATVLLAIDARFRVIPALSEKSLKSLAVHVFGVTVLSVLFVYVGIGFRSGSLF